MLIRGTAINAPRRGGGGRAAHHLSACEDHQALGQESSRFQRRPSTSARCRLESVRVTGAARIGHRTQTIHTPEQHVVCPSGKIMPRYRSAGAPNAGFPTSNPTITVSLGRNRVPFTLTSRLETHAHAVGPSTRSWPRCPSDQWRPAMCARRTHGRESSASSLKLVDHKPLTIARSQHPPSETPPRIIVDEHVRDALLLYQRIAHRLKPAPQRTPVT